MVLDIDDNELGPQALAGADIELLLRTSAPTRLPWLILLPLRSWGSAGEVDVAAWWAGDGPRPGE